VLPEGIRRLFRLERGPHGVTADVDLEIQHHFAAAVEDLVRRGMDPEAARAEVARRFGDVGATRSALTALSRGREQARQRRDWWGDWALDARYALRSLGRTPGVTAAVIVLLALGIGANAAMFGILDQLFLSPPPHVRAPDDVLRLHRQGRDARRGVEFTFPLFAPDEYATLDRDVAGFAEMAGYNGPEPKNVGRGQQSHRINVAMVTGTYFPLLGTVPARGRFFEPEDDQPAATPVAVIGDGYWRRRYGASADAIGATITVDQVAYTIVGIAPSGFSGPDIIPTDVWVPVEIAAPAARSVWRRVGSGFGLHVLARLRPGLTAALAAEQTTAALRAFAATEPRVERFGVTALTGPLVASRGPGTLPGSMRLSLVVSGVALVVLLIACANVANLLILRAAMRRRELAVRSALGAGRWRTGRLLVLESLSLAAAAALASAVVAALAGRGMQPLLQPADGWAFSINEWRVLLFAGGTAMVVGLLAGLAPAVQASGSAGVDDLRTGVRAARRERSPLRATLLVLQSALTLTLLVGAGVFVRSFEAARRADLGFDLERLLVVELWHVDRRDRSPLSEASISSMEERIRSLPGVSGVAQSTNSLMGRSTMIPFRVRGLDSLPGGRGAYVNGVSANYFSVVGLAITRGRRFTPADDERAPKVAIVNGAMAEHLWPGRDPLGDCLYVGAGAADCATIVGIVESEHGSARYDDVDPLYCVPVRQLSLASGERALVVRTDGDPARLVEPALRILGDVFPDLPRERVRALPDVLAPQLRSWKLGSTLFGAASGLALLLAAVGLYSVIAFGVRRREHEFGIRRAMGAEAGHLVRLVLTQSVVYALTGIVLGAGLACWGAGLIAPLLHREVSPREPAAYAVSAIILLAACLAGALMPARTAARADPRAALQAE